MSMIQGFSAGWIPYDREKAVLYPIHGHWANLSIMIIPT